MFVVLVMMFVAMALPVGAQDNVPPAPTPTTITIQIGGIIVTLSLPVRCGNNC